MALIFVWATLLAVVFDWVVGDPPKLPHPVRFIGNFISALTKRLNHGEHRRLKGAVLTVCTVGVTVLVVGTIMVITYRIHFWLGFTTEVVLIGTALAQKSLKEAAMAVYTPIVAGDWQEARTKLSWIVGRDTMHLEEDELVRGVVETVSENTSDGVTAPLFYALLFGAVGVWAYKAINTLDSMVGYKNDKYAKFGTCSAVLDDIVNYIPSRITGLLIVLLTKNDTPQTLKQRLTRWWRDAKVHPSPNSGYLEAATAVQLGIQLGGYNQYEGVTSYRQVMGEKQVPLTRAHIKKVITHMHIATLGFTIIGAGIVVALHILWEGLR